MATGPVIVVGAGERPPEHLKDLAKEARLIGVDRGAHWILRWGLVPERVVGDLDSLDERTRNYADQYGTPIERTDDELLRGDLARTVDLLVEERPDDVVFTGCVGPRLDHLFSLFAAVARLAATGARVRVIETWGAGEVAGPGRPVQMENVAGERAALYPLSAVVRGISLSGFDAGEEPPTEMTYPEVHAGVRIVSDPVEVSVQEGALFVFVPRREAPGTATEGPMGGKPTFRLGTLERTE